MFKTNMNDRERSRYAKQLRELADYANKSAVALENDDDNKFVLNFLSLSMLGGIGISEIHEVLKSSIKDLKDEVKPSDFPEFIEFIEK